MGVWDIRTNLLQEPKAILIPSLVVKKSPLKGFSDILETFLAKGSEMTRLLHSSDFYKYTVIGRVIQAFFGTDRLVIMRCSFHAFLYFGASICTALLTT